MITLTGYGSEESIVNSIHVSLQLEQEKHIMAMLNPTLTAVGEQWCCIWGEEDQLHIAGYGKTPAQAITDFCRGYYAGSTYGKKPALNTSRVITKVFEPLKNAPNPGRGEWTKEYTAPGTLIKWIAANDRNDTYTIGLIRREDGTVDEIPAWAIKFV